MYKFKENKYSKWYYNIIKNAIIRNTKTDVEHHHIVPKSLGGLNDKTNLAPLTMREHFICHLLLIRMVKDADVYRMVHAIVRFTQKINTATEYELLRKYVSRFSKGEYNKAFGKIWIHDKVTKEISFITQHEFNEEIHNKGLPCQRGGHRDYTWVNNKISESMISKERDIPTGWSAGRITIPPLAHMKRMAASRHTKEKDKEHSKKISGKKHVNYGKPAFNKGRVWINDTQNSKMIKPELLESHINNGWIKGRL